MKFYLIAACDKENGIGKNNSIPWHSKQDLSYFYNKTSTRSPNKNALVMGIKTFNDIIECVGEKIIQGDNGNRIFIVCTNNTENIKQYNDKVKYYNGDISPWNLRLFIEQNNNFYIDKVFYCGGQSIYDQALSYIPYMEEIYITQFVEQSFACDKHIQVDHISSLCSRICCSRFTCDSLGLGFFMTYAPTWSLYEDNKYESKYMNLCKNIMLYGEWRDDRTGVGTVSLFGTRMCFDLSNDTIPALTTKKLAYNAVIKELLWFISGSTNSKVLEEQNVKIWTGNTSREFLDKRGLNDLEEGDIGAGYGFQWRHFGADYNGMTQNYDNQGVDQLKNIVHMLKHDKKSRRILLSAWNPAMLNKMALPPCHLLVQFYVTNENELCCQMYQRSSDIFLGVPFNIFSYALLTHMLAKTCSLKAKKLVLCFGDTHIYQNHINQINSQLSRVPMKFPKILLNEKVESIFDYAFDDIKVLNYDCHPVIRASMAV